jgi:hypothetical protein
MGARGPSPSIGVGWVSICGVVIARVALKETVRLLGESPLAVAPRRPSTAAVLVVPDNVGRLGRGALGLRARRLTLDAVVRAATPAVSPW